MSAEKAVPRAEGGSSERRGFGVTAVKCEAASLQGHAGLLIYYTVSRTSLKCFIDPKSKYVYVERNPWDCCVSCYNYVREIPVCKLQDGIFDEFLDAFLERHSNFGDYFDHVPSDYRRRKERNVFFVTYEEH
ncbi:hypothetical protein HPB47_018075 [Ixodes persulcatus]|uniref:Uncharacterized protein n=1 Tax=Ixodes persulcatus TaxID=34615 RepID=A0AC60QLV4_IXOPE|nr:hypothetical protein HPB47_018075 [Ixodes persulcatus]